MLHFFKKKTSFIDIWSGTPEMHSHVLPGIDDGSKDIKTSQVLIEKYKELGCPHIIATPHTMHGIYDNTPNSIETSYTSIKDKVSGIKLSYSSEYMIDENFGHLLDTRSILPVHGTYILIEMSYFQPPENIKEIIFKIGTLGYIPILAHPERYSYYHNKPEVFKDFKSRGCLLQLNALSLSNHYGKYCQKTAVKLLEESSYDFIGIDTHKIEHLNKIETMNISTSQVRLLEKVCYNTASIFS